VRGGAFALAAVVAAGAAGTVAAVRWPATATSVRTGSTVRMSLPAVGIAAVPLCPGPQGLVAPAGAEAVPLTGPVAVAALTSGDTATLGGRPVPVATTDAARFGALTLARPVAGTVALEPDGAGRAALELSAVQLGLARSGDARGLVAVNCTTASTQTWLVGGGTSLGRRARLLLANPALTPATVDVAVHGPRGVVEAPQGNGVVVPARGQVAVQVDALAPDLSALALQVRARSGRVSAVLHDTLVRGANPAGADDVTAAAPAGRTQWVPGVSVSPPGTGALPTKPDDPGAVAVRVANPGPEPAVARVRLVGDAGSVPLDRGVVSLAAGAVTDVPVTGVPAGMYAAVVEADAPVVAGALVGRAAAARPAEFGWAASVAPLTTPVVTALPSLTEDGRRTAVAATLALTAPGASSSVEVTEVGATGDALRTVTVTVAAGTTLAQPVTAGAAGVRLRPADGVAVVAALVLQAPDPSGPTVAVLPVRPGPAGGGSRPDVVADPRLGLRG
jgi:hypothetical protein